MLMRILTLLVIGLALMPSPVRAQPAPAVGPGSLVAVWTGANPAPVIGKVVSRDTTSLTLALRGLDAPTVIPQHTVTRIDIGRRKGRAHGALAGAAVGILTGVIVGVLAGDDESGLVRFTRQDKAMITSIITAPLGALVGLGIGSGTRWTTTTLAPGPSAPPVPRLAATVRVRF
jgi:hypothetical protein